MKAVSIELSTGRTPRVTALLEGVKNKGIELLTAGRPEEVARSGADFAVCSGMNRLSVAGRAECVKLGIPVLIVELGYLRRANNNRDLLGYYQLGWDRLCWTPETAASDRFDALGLTVTDAAGGQAILVASQVGNDAQHRMTAAELNTWLRCESAIVAAELRQPRIWRPHPNQVDQVPSDWPAARVQLPAKVPLSQALNGISTVVTYNSTFGVDAMLQGVPVHSHPSAHYHRHAVADRPTRLAYLHRLAYAQWTLDEMRDGTALDFVLNHLPTK